MGDLFDSAHFSEWDFPESSGDGSENEENECKHQVMHEFEDGEVCYNCGFFYPKLDYSYDREDSRGSRCQYKGKEIRTIDDVFYRKFLVMPIDRDLDIINEKYQRVVINKKVRGKTRDAVVAICYMWSMRERGDVYSTGKIGEMFKLPRKVLTEALNKYYAAFPADRVKYVKPMDLVKNILISQNQLDAKGCHCLLEYLPQIQRLCELLKNKSVSINRSNPQSVAAAITCLFLKIKSEREGTTFDKRQFARNVRLSEITIEKISKEIVSIFGIPLGIPKI